MVDQFPKKNRICEKSCSDKTYFRNSFEVPNAPEPQLLRSAGDYSRAKVKTHFLRSIMIFPETDLSENRTIIPVPLNHFEGVPIFWHAKIQIKLGSISHLSLFCLVNTINPYSCCKSQEIPRHLCLGNHSFCLTHVNFSPFLSCDQPSHIGRELVPDITKRRAERSCRNPASLSWYNTSGRAPAIYGISWYLVGICCDYGIWMGFSGICIYIYTWSLPSGNLCTSLWSGKSLFWIGKSWNLIAMFHSKEGND